MYIHSFEPLVHSFEPLVHSFEPWVSTLPLITTTTTNDTLSTPYKKRKIITCFNTDNYYDTEYDYEEQVFDDAGAYEMNLGKQLDKTNSFRRIIYRVANSVGMRTGDWKVGGNKNLFFWVLRSRPNMEQLHHGCHCMKWRSAWLKKQRQRGTCT
jgi:hypothetical protein